MNRKIFAQLAQWKQSNNRKPLILRGARQVGKTYALKKFGAAEFPNVHYFNFEEDDKLTLIFENDLKPQRILEELRFHSNRNINLATDLVIFDEIQRSGRALTSLKYFCENMPELALCAAGSLLGLSLSEASFPVGKITFLDVWPLDFIEFIDALGQHELVMLMNSHNPVEPYPILAHNKLWELWKQYCIVGGLPSVVKEFAQYQENLFEACTRVRKLQRDLFEMYLADIAKHCGKINALHIERVWRNIPEQLARTLDGSAPKFKFKDVLHGIRGYEKLAGPIDWLERAMLIIKTGIVEKPLVPLSAYSPENSFKLYCFDVGMLGAIGGIQPEIFLKYNFGSYQGYVAENFVAQEFVAARNEKLYCWQGRTSEIEFLVSTSDGVIPIEVKSGNVIHSKSLNVYESKFFPQKSILFSARNSEISGTRKQMPLYASGMVGHSL